MAGQTTTLLDHVSVAVDSNVLYCQRVKEETGVCQVYNPGGGTYSLKLQGRPNSAAPWYTIKIFTQAGNDALGQQAVLMALFPEMQVSLTAIATGQVSAWLVE